MKNILFIGTLLLIAGCHNTYEMSRSAEQMNLNGIKTYHGQSSQELYNRNGAPNMVKKLSHDNEMWIYYTNFKEASGGNFMQGYAQQRGTACTVQVILSQNQVVNIQSDCE